MTPSREIPEQFQFLGQTIDLILEAQRNTAQRLRALERRLDDELEEIRDGLIDVDHSVGAARRSIAATRQVLNSLQEDGA